MQNFLRLGLRQSVQAISAHAVSLLQPIRTVVVGVDRATISAHTGEHFAHQFAVPRLGHQLYTGHWWRGGAANNGNKFVDIGQSHSQAFQHVAALACLAQVEYGAASDHFAAVLQKDFNQVFQVAQLGLAVNQGHHVHAKGVLQLRLFVQVVEHHFRDFAALEFNHQAHARLVRLVLNVADAFNLLFMDQLGHAFLQCLFVDLVGQLVHDDGLALAFVNVFKVALGTHHHLAATGAVAVLHAIDTVNNTGGGEVWCGNDFHQLINRGQRVAQQIHAGVDHFIQVVGRDVGRHTHRNAARTVDEQVGQARGHDQGLLFRAIVVGSEVNRFFVQIGQELMSDFG